ncbi:MAG: 2Fe-2S iron-sulfur cluster binding domain-containing protein [Gammaproteobacteria bacterium]|nr:2Fe-2S iron-sulfur cluster binding domain-containing protein [Gammaproteobacteria bacterium]
MLSYHPLVLTRRSPIAEDACCLEFEPPTGEAGAFAAFEAGQHLPVRATVQGRELRRTYSLVSPAGGPLRIGVRVQGAMSRYLAESLPIGGVLESMTPTGRFRRTVEPARHGRYLALAAGSGITPVLSIVTTILEREPHSRVVLLYGNRTLARSMFVEEILALKNRHLRRFTAQFLMSREPQDVELFNGRLDAPRLRTLAESEFDPREFDEIFVCGPGSMVREASSVLKDLGATGKIHLERFTAESGASRERDEGDAGAAAAREGTEAVVTMDGRRRSFGIAEGQTVLEAAEAAGLALPFSCRAGVCSTCRAKLLSGSVTMERNQALEDWEVAAGFVLCCQSRPTSAKIEISYDEK